MLALKGQIVNMLTKMYADEVKDLEESKATQGFAHKMTGQLLCPVHLDWDNQMCMTE